MSNVGERAERVGRGGGHAAGGSAHRIRSLSSKLVDVVDGVCSNPDQLQRLPHRPDKCQRLKMQQQQQSVRPI